MRFPARQPTPKRTCVLVAEATAMASSLLVAGLRRHTHLRVLACALERSALSRAMDRYAPDVALISAQSDGGAPDGYAVMPRIHHQHPATRVVYLLDRSDRETVVEAFRAGGSGVFCRSTHELKLLRRCVEAVAQGQIWANSKELGYLLDAYRQAVPQRVLHSESIVLLTPREQDVYCLVADGPMNREIAQQLGLSERTVKNTYSTSSTSWGSRPASNLCCMPPRMGRVRQRRRNRSRRGNRC